MLKIVSLAFMFMLLNYCYKFGFAFGDVLVLKLPCGWLLMKTINIQEKLKRKCMKFYKTCYGARTIACGYHMKYIMKQGNRFLCSYGWNWVRETLNIIGDSCNQCF